MEVNIGIIGTGQNLQWIKEKSTKGEYVPNWTKTDTCPSARSEQVACPNCPAKRNSILIFHIVCVPNI